MQAGSESLEYDKMTEQMKQEHQQELKTVTEFLRELKAYNEKMQGDYFRFSERESAKAELVRSLLRHVDACKLKP